MTGKHKEFLRSLCYNLSIFAQVICVNIFTYRPRGAARRPRHELLKEERTAMPNTFVIAMGVGTVFFGLICIIILSSLMSAICTKLGKREPAAPAPAAPVAPATAEIPNRQALIAAVSAAVAEDMGTDPAGIRILSFKQL